MAEAMLPSSMRCDEQYSLRIECKINVDLTLFQPFFKFRVIDGLAFGNMGIVEKIGFGI